MTRNSFFARLFAGAAAILGSSLLRPFLRRGTPHRKAPDVQVHPLAVPRSSQHEQTHA